MQFNGVMAEVKQAVGGVLRRQRPRSVRELRRLLDGL
jgi:hypothetical protein